MYRQEVRPTPSGHRAAVAMRRERGSFRGTGDHPTNRGENLRARRSKNGYPTTMLSKMLARAGVRGWYLHMASLGSIGLCIGLWIRAKTVDQDERGNAERRALFVGLWPPMFWLIGDSVQDRE